DFDPAFKAGVRSKKEGRKLLERGIELLAEYQSRLYAPGTHGGLIVLQALDAAGKDGTIRHVMSGVNPQGVSVHSFKVPSSEELDHDYFWRYAHRLPGRGEIGRAKLPPDSRGPGLWKQRFQEINNWEHSLSDNGIKIVKLFLNLSREEQRTRFLRRIDLPDHNWKFSSADVRERESWNEYQKAFSEL